MWDREGNLCSPAGIPKDRTFTILVALLTTILSVPLLVAFTFVLEQYGSTWPGSRGIEDDVGKDEDPEPDDNGESAVGPDSAAALRHSTRKSDFEEVIKRAVLRGGMSGKDLSAEIVQRAYAGK
jgi:hypothetical protein